MATACRLAVETACRAALEQLGFDYDGDLELALARLGAPPRRVGAAAGRDRPPAVWPRPSAAVAWFASYLRHAAPGRSEPGGTEEGHG